MKVANEFEPAAARKIDIDQDQIGPRSLHCFEGLGSIASLGADLQVRLAVKLLDQPLSDDRVIIHDKDPVAF